MKHLLSEAWRNLSPLVVGAVLALIVWVGWRQSYRDGFRDGIAFKGAAVTNPIADPSSYGKNATRTNSSLERFK